MLLCILFRITRGMHITARGGALGELAPTKGYSTSTRIGILSCGPLSVRPRRDSHADAHSDAVTNARAHHCRAGRCAVGYELVRVPECPEYHGGPFYYEYLIPLLRSP